MQGRQGQHQPRPWAAMRAARGCRCRRTRARPARPRRRHRRRKRAMMVHRSRRRPQAKKRHHGEALRRSPPSFERPAKATSRARLVWQAAGFWSRPVFGHGRCGYPPGRSAAGRSAGSVLLMLPFSSCISPIPPAPPAAASADRVRHGVAERGKEKRVRICSASAARCGAAAIVLSSPLARSPLRFSCRSESAKSRALASAPFDAPPEEPMPASFIRP